MLTLKACVAFGRSSAFITLWLLGCHNIAIYQKTDTFFYNPVGHVCSLPLKLLLKHVQMNSVAVEALSTWPSELNHYYIIYI